MSGNRTSGIRPAVVKYMQDNKGLVVTGDQIADALQIFTRDQILQCLSNLSRDKTLPIERVGNGIYRWTVNPSEDILELRIIQHTPKYMVACGPDGTLYTINKVNLP